MIEKGAVEKALVAQWASIDELLGSLPEADWATPSALPGWTVHDLVAHLIGTESMLLGKDTPPSDDDVSSLPHVHNDIAAFNERWVLAIRALTPKQALAEYRDVIAQRTAALAAMTQDDFDAPSWTPVGQGTYGRFMQIRLFDCWLHEQDIRDAVGRPGHEAGPCAEVAIDEVMGAIGYLVGKRAGAPDGSSVTIELTGPVRRSVHVAVDGRAKVVAELPGPATTTVRLGSGLFARLAGGRVSPDDHLAEVDIQGDADLGRQLVRNLAFTI